MKNTDNLDRTIWIADNLPFLRKLDTESVDLVVIDPPFGKQQTFKGNLRPPLTDAELEHEYDLMAKWGVQNEVEAYDVGIEFPDQKGTTAKFADIWDFRFQVMQDDWDRLGQICPAARALIDATRFTHSDWIAGYITFMTLRMLEIRRILKPTGSVYLHCDHEANAYLRQMMDAVFGQNQFRNEITWVRHTSNQRGSQYMPRKYSNVVDTILFYAKSRKTSISAFRPLTEDERVAKFNRVDEKGDRYYDDSSHIWSTPNMGARPNLCYEWRGFTNPHPSGWRLSRERLEEEYRKGNIVILDDGKRLQRRKYERDWRGRTQHNVWDDIRPVAGQSEASGYPTQKPQALAKRIIEASSNPGDLVLDCFAGCAYVPVASELLGRRWIACDMSPRAWTVVRRQFEKQPDLGIVTEGIDIGAVQEKLDTAGKVIRVRGPDELPVRTTVDRVQRRMPMQKDLVFRQKPKETSQQIWEAFVTEWGPECWYCATPMARDRRVLQLDHVEPRDGTNDDCWNRALSCAPCNSDKRDTLTPEETIEKAYETGRISTPARRDEQLGRFNTYMAWARERWEDVQTGRIEDPA